MVKLQNLALKAYPPPVDLPVESLNKNLANDQQRVDRENRENENRRIFAIMERDRHVNKTIQESIAKLYQTQTPGRTRKCHNPTSVHGSKTKIDFERTIIRTNF